MYPPLFLHIRDFLCPDSCFPQEPKCKQIVVGSVIQKLFFIAEYFYGITFGYELTWAGTFFIQKLSIFAPKKSGSENSYGEDAERSDDDASKRDAEYEKKSSDSFPSLFQVDATYADSISIAEQRSALGLSPNKPRVSSIPSKVPRNLMLPGFVMPAAPQGEQLAATGEAAEGTNADAWMEAMRKDAGCADVARGIMRHDIGALMLNRSSCRAYAEHEPLYWPYGDPAGKVRSHCDRRNQ
jgi:hypothetical protein